MQYTLPTRKTVPDNVPYQQLQHQIEDFQVTIRFQYLFGRRNPIFFEIMMRLYVDIRTKTDAGDDADVEETRTKQMRLKNSNFCQNVKTWKLKNLEAFVTQKTLFRNSVFQEKQNLKDEKSWHIIWSDVKCKVPKANDYPGQ